MKLFTFTWPELGLPYHVCHNMQYFVDFHILVGLLLTVAGQIKLSNSYSLNFMSQCKEYVVRKRHYFRSIPNQTFLNSLSVAGQRKWAFECSLVFSLQNIFESLLI